MRLMKYGRKLMRSKIFILLLCLIQSMNIYSQTESETFVIIEIKSFFYPKKEVPTYWIIPQASIRGNTFDMYPLYIDTLSYNIIDEEKDTIPYLRDNMCINRKYEMILLGLLSKIDTKSFQVQCIRKRWNSRYRHFDSFNGHKLDIKVNALPVKGIFIKKTLAYQNYSDGQLKYTMFYVPISPIVIDESFYSNSKKKVIEFSDFSQFNPLELMPKELYDNSIVPIMIKYRF
jgi:hypothetical protein